MCEPHIRQEARPPRKWPWNPRTTLHHRASIWSTWPVYQERSPLSRQADREGPERWLNVRTITMVQHKIPAIISNVRKRHLKWSLCWVKQTPPRRSSFLLVCANNSRDKTSIHAFPWNEETVKHFLVALSAELKPSTTTGMLSVFHSQFHPVSLNDLPFQPPPDWLPWQCRLTVPATPSSRSHTPSRAQGLHTADTLHDYSRIGKTFSLFASRLCKVSYPE